MNRKKRVPKKKVSRITTRSDITRNRVNEKTRNKIQHLRLLSLEKDNYDDEDDKNRKARAKIDYFVESVEDPKNKKNGRKSSRKKKRVNYNEDEMQPKSKRRRMHKIFLRRKLNHVLETELKSQKEKNNPNYFTAKAKESRFPRRHFCELCGSFANYTCYNCGLRYCSSDCCKRHKEKRCFKYR